MKHLSYFTFTIYALLTFNLEAQNKYSDYNNKKTTFVYEDFSNNNRNWRSGTSNESNGFVSDGHYYWNSLNAKSKNSTRPFYNFDDTRDFEIEVRFRRWSGAENNALHALIFGGGYDERFYFGYTPNGSFRVDEYKDSKYKIIKNYTKTTAINKTGFNKLTIRKIGNKFEFYINSVFVYSTYARKLHGVRFGFQTPKYTKLKIDYLKLSYLKPSYAIYNAVSVKKKFPFFEEYFLNNKNNWSKGDGITSKGFMGSYTYYWQSLESKTKSTSKFISIDTSKDFELEAKIRCLSAGKNTILQSFIFGGVGNKRYYFGFNTEGSFRISKYDGSKYVAIKDWAESSAIKPNNYNLLTVRKIENTMYFFINEKLVHQCKSLKFYGNKFGFEAASNSKLEIDDLMMSYIEGL